MSCLTALFCILTILYNFASAPPFGGAQVAVLAAASSDAGASAGAGASAEPSSLSAGSSASGGAGDDADDEGTAAVSGASSAASPRASSSGAAKSGSSSVSFPVNVNTAGREELTALPGIGETIADRIVAYRQANGAFRSLEDLDNVKGIGSTTLEKLKGKVSF